MSYESRSQTTNMILSFHFKVLDKLETCYNSLQSTKVVDKKETSYDSLLSFQIDWHNWRPVVIITFTLKVFDQIGDLLLFFFPKVHYIIQL